jgi:serine/threonine protein kinase
VVEVGDDATPEENELDVKAFEDGYRTPHASSHQYKPALDHPGQLFQFPTPPAYTAPPNPTSHISPYASGSTSELFLCVVKKPDVTQVEINGELQSNLSDVRQQFLAELRVYRTVTRHRNIIAFMGCLENLGMVLEFVQGAPLLDVIRDRANPLDRTMKVDFHNQLLSGLAHVHSFGLSHGDLSLLNVHVTSSQPRTLKILDFGRSVATSTYVLPESKEMSFHAGMRRSRSSGMSVPLTPGPIVDEIHPGTRPFSAPEILRGECIDPILADAYSFGMILLCLDLGGLVDMDPDLQMRDAPVDTSGCEIFTARIRWYTTSWKERRMVRKDDRIAH